MTSLDDFNHAGVFERAGRPPADVVAEFAAGDAETRRRLRERDGGEMDSSVGPYPVRWQAFHIATELATHADDIGVPVPEDEAADRLAWRTAFSRFALSERRPGAVIEAAPGGTRVQVDDLDVVVDGPRPWWPGWWTGWATTSPPRCRPSFRRPEPTGSESSRDWPCDGGSMPLRTGVEPKACTAFGSITRRTIG